MNLTPHQVELFWSKVNRGDDDVCWEWQGAETGSMGYGQVYMNGRLHQAHRIAWAIENGREPDPNLDTCHSCDNPKCVNPNHTSECTRQRNMQEAALRGRINTQKLTPAQVLEIREAPGKHAEIAARYSLHPATISKIKKGVTWGWL